MVGDHVFSQLPFLSFLWHFLLLASLQFSGPAFKIGTLCAMVLGLGSQLCLEKGFQGILGLARFSEDKLGLVEAIYLRLG